MSRVTLELLGAGGVLFRHDLDAGPLRIGRAAGNEISLTDPEISGHHCVIAKAGGQVTVTDLRSTNGSHINGRRISRSEVLRDGDVLALGDDTQMAVSLPRLRSATATLVLEDRTAGVLHTQLAHACSVAGTPVQVGVRSGEQVAVTIGDRSVEVGLDELFTVGEHELVLRMSDLSATTRRADSSAYPYRVTAGLESAKGPFARFEDPVRSVTHDLRSENRAVLVFLLAQSLEAVRGADADAGGWCDDDAIRVGIWGASSRGQLSNNLNVLVRRTRKELFDHGFDGLCIQKIHGHTRLCVDRAEVA